MTVARGATGGLLLLLACLGVARGTRPLTPANPPLALRLNVVLEPTGLRVQLRNPTDRPIRVWALGNSWAGDAWSVRVSSIDEPARWFTLRSSRQGYTRNVPACVEIPSQGEREVRLTPSGPEWTAGEDVGPLRGVALNVEAALEIAPTPESAKHGVAEGRAESRPVLSRPPHAWLFAAP